MMYEGVLFHNENHPVGIKDMFHVRTANLFDRTGLMQVERACFPEPISERSMNSFLSDPENRICFVAVGTDADDGVIGYLAAQFVEDEAEILNIAVLPEYRERGIGGRLLDRVERFCGQNAIRILHLEVRRNNERAISLYEKHGFERVGLRKGYYDAGKADALLYARRFDP